VSFACLVVHGPARHWKQSNGRFGKSLKNTANDDLPRDENPRVGGSTEARSADRRTQCELA